MPRRNVNCIRTQMIGRSFCESRRGGSAGMSWSGSTGGVRVNEALTFLLKVLDELGIRYFAVGSVASSVHGLPRFTQDVDLVVQLDQTHVVPIASLTSREFYMD